MLNGDTKTLIRWAGVFADGNVYKQAKIRKYNPHNIKIISLPDLCKSWKKELQVSWPYTWRICRWSASSIQTANYYISALPQDVDKILSGRTWVLPLRLLPRKNTRPRCRGGLQGTCREGGDDSKRETRLPSWGCLPEGKHCSLLLCLGNTRVRGEKCQEILAF